MTRFQFSACATGEDFEYLVRCARIRKMGVTSLVRVVMQTIIRDQMVQAILDDDYSRPRYCHPYRGPQYGEPAS